MTEVRSRIVRGAQELEHDPPVESGLAQGSADLGPVDPPLAGWQMVVAAPVVVMGVDVGRPAIRHLEKPTPVATERRVAGVEAHPDGPVERTQKPPELVRMATDEMRERRLDRQRDAFLSAAAGQRGQATRGILKACLNVAPFSRKIAWVDDGETTAEAFDGSGSGHDGVNGPAALHLIRMGQVQLATERRMNGHGHK